MIHLLPHQVQSRVEIRDLVLQRGNLCRHLFVFLRVLEGAAAVRAVDTLQIEVAASLARRLAIALDLPSLAFVTATIQCE